MSDESDEYMPDPVSLGAAISAYLISINTLNALHAAGKLTDEQRIDVVKKSKLIVQRRFSTDDPAGAEALKHLDNAQSLFLTAAAKPSSTPN